MKPFLFGLTLVGAFLFGALAASAASNDAAAFRVPASELANLDDSCRSWLIVFTNSTPDADGRFLLDAHNSYGLGSTVRFKHITEAQSSAWSQWAWLHGSQNTMATLTPDQQTVLSIVNTSGMPTSNGYPASKIPSQLDAKGRFITPAQRQLALASLLELEAPDGKRGRLFDSAKPPFWLPNRRAEQWYSKCPQPQPNQPAPNVNVEVNRIPQMDPNLAAAIEAEKKALAEAAALKEAEDIRIEKEAWEAEQRKKDTGNFTALAVVLALLAMVSAPVVGVVVANFFGGD